MLNIYQSQKQNKWHQKSWLNYSCCTNIKLKKHSEKGGDLTQSYDKSPYTDRKIQNATWKHKNATKNFDYTTIADLQNGQLG